MHTHHDDADANPDPADDVQFAVEHLVNSRRTALISQGGKKNLETEDRLHGGRQQQRQHVRPAGYRGDEDLQPLLFRADVFGRVNHRPCWAAAVQLQPESQISHNISSSRDKEVNL